MSQLRNRHKIYPNEWVGGRPYGSTGSADVYYAGVATTVNEILQDSYVRTGIIQDDVATRRAAIALTGLFEDIVSGIGIWDFFVGECLRRYGRELPFYDLSDYVRGEINLQDVSLLLWDILQSHQEANCLLNPENPYLAEIARQVFAVFDAEYEYAEENTRLKSFLTDPEIGAGYWKVRHRLEWILQSSFINHRYLAKLDDDLEDAYESEVTEHIGFDKAMYYLLVRRLYDFRGNLLSMRTTEILSAISGQDPDGIIAGMRLLTPMDYLFVDVDKRHLTLRRLADEKIIPVEMDSFSSLDTSMYRKGDSSFNCTLVNYGEKWYQAGLMSGTPLGRSPSSDELGRQRCDLQGRLPEEFLKQLWKSFNGLPFAFFTTYEEMMKFLKDAMGGAPVPDMPDMEGVSLEGPYLVTIDPQVGLHISSGYNSCICAEGNPYYNKAEAEKDAIAFFTYPPTCSYEASCYLQDHGLLPDARINSLQGEEHGRALLQDNGRFLTDYFFRRYRGDE